MSTGSTAERGDRKVAPLVESALDLDGAVAIPIILGIMTIASAVLIVGGV